MSTASADELRYLSCVREAQIAFERGVHLGRMEQENGELLPTEIAVGFKSMVDAGHFTPHLVRFEEVGRAVGRAYGSANHFDLRAPVYDPGARNEGDEPQTWRLVVVRPASKRGPDACRGRTCYRILAAAPRKRVALG